MLLLTDKLRILICGGRHFCDYVLLEKTVDGAIKEFNCLGVEIVSGHCKCADMLGELYVQKRNAALKIFPAEWGKYGEKAGVIRNKKMVDYISGFANKIVIAFVSRNTRGTRNTITLAKRNGIRVIETEYEV